MLVRWLTPFVNAYTHCHLSQSLYAAKSGKETATLPAFLAKRNFFGQKGTTKCMDKYALLNIDMVGLPLF